MTKTEAETILNAYYKLYDRWRDDPERRETIFDRIVEIESIYGLDTREVGDNEQ